MSVRMSWPPFATLRSAPGPVGVRPGYHVQSHPCLVSGDDLPPYQQFL